MLIPKRFAKHDSSSLSGNGVTKCWTSEEGVRLCRADEVDLFHQFNINLLIVQLPNLNNSALLLTLDNKEIKKILSF